MRWLVWVCAVGCVASGGDDPDRASGQGDETENGTWDGPLTGIAETDDTPRRSRDPDAPPGDTDGEGSPGLCGRGPDQNVGISERDGTISLLRGDRSERQLLLLDVPPLPADSNLYADFTLNEELVAVAVGWTIPGEAFEFGAAIQVFGPDGSPRWGVRQDAVSFDSPYIGAHGSIVVTRTPEGGGIDMVLFDEAGGETSVPDFYARGGMLPGGLVPGHLSTDFEFTPGWMDSQTGDFQPLSQFANNPWFRDGHIIYFTPVSLIDETVDGFVEYDPFEGEAIFLESISYPWVLVTTPGGDRFARISIESGLMEEVEIVPPPGSISFDCFSLNPRIDSEGGILFSTRDDYSAVLTRYDPTNDEYASLGSRRVNIDEINGHTVKGTSLVDAVPPGFGFCDPHTWEPSEEDFLEAGLEIVRPENGFRMFIEDSFNNWVYTNDEGTCLVHQSGSSTALIDVVTGAKHEFGVEVDFDFPD